MFGIRYSGEILDQIRLFLNRLQSKHPTYETLFQVSNVLGLPNVRLDSIPVIRYEPFQHSQTVLKILILPTNYQTFILMLVLRIWWPDFESHHNRALRSSCACHMQKLSSKILYQTCETSHFPSKESVSKCRMKNEINK